MTSAPILRHPDFTRPFIIYTDASYTGMGYILAQEIDGHEHPICYGSRRTLPSKNNYSVTDLEGAAVVWAIDKNRHYFNTKTPVMLVTDHKAFTTIFTQDLPEDRRRARWILKLNQYKITLRHRKGRNMAYVDYLSRYLISQVTFDPCIQEQEIYPDIYWASAITVVEGRTRNQDQHHRSYEERCSETVMVSEKDLGLEEFFVQEPPMAPRRAMKASWVPPQPGKAPPPS